MNCTYIHFSWGEARHRNGSTYHGYWNEGKRHGYGEAKTYVYTKIGPKSTSNINSRYLYNTQDFSSNQRETRIVRLEEYAGEWRDGIKNGFGILEIEMYTPQESRLFPIQDSTKYNITETLSYEGCWKDGFYDGWVSTFFLGSSVVS